MTLIALAGCGSDVEPDLVAVADTPPAAPDAVAPAGSCDLVPRAEIERLAGPLDGEPVREGNGCWFYVVSDTTSAEWRQQRAGAERARAGGMDPRAIELYHPTRAGLFVELDTRGDGQVTTEKPAHVDERWDEVRISPSGERFHGRTGFVRISLKAQLLRVPSDTLIAFASRVRDRIPQGPMAHPAADRSGRTPPGQDPCSVLTRDVAEPVLGKLVAEPYRTRERTPLADPAGKSCAYLTAGHRVLVLTPVWDYAGVELSAARMVGGVVRQLAELPGIEGDTLEGKFDEAVVDLAGELLLRKGGRGLGVRYQMSSTDAAGAIRLAEAALLKLAAQPDPDE